MLGVIVLLAGAAFYFLLSEQVREVVEKAQGFRESAKKDLRDETNPTRNVNALRNLAIALSLNRKDTEAARLARDLLLQGIWCPPIAPEVRYQKNALLAATFAPGGINNKVFAVAGDGQLLRWDGGRELSPIRSLFDKPKADLQHVVQPGFASFSPDGQWLFIVPPTLASASNVDGPAQASPQQTTAEEGNTGGRAGSDNEPSKLQMWRWSMRNQTYETAGQPLKIKRLPGSRINFAWSPESDRVVVVNVRSTNESECAFFAIEGNAFRELADRSTKLTELRIVALSLAARRSGIAVVYVDSETPTLRKVSFIGADDLEIMPDGMHGQDSIRLSEGFQPNAIAFGPASNQLTLTSWSGARILDLLDGTVTPFPPPTFRDQFVRILPGPYCNNTRIVAISLYGRVQMALQASGQAQYPAEFVLFRGPIGIPQFSPDGQRMLILSGGIGNVLDTMRLIDISPMCRIQESAPERFEEKPAPAWLAEIASAASALDTSADGSLVTLEAVRQKYPASKAGDPYEAVWKRFFPDERSK